MTKNLSLLLLICACIFNANGQAGSPDHAFGNNGIVTTAFLDTANTLSEEGRVVLIGANGNIFVMARLSPNSSYTRIVKYLPGGRLDSSYGKGGYSTTTNLVATSAVMQGDKIIVTGGFPNPGIPDNIAFARYTPAGLLDTSFGENGIVKTNFYNYQANAIVLQGNKIIVGGYGDNYQFFLACFTANGSPDSSFGENGKVTTDFNSSNSFIRAIVLQKDKILVAGGALNAVTYKYDFALARYTGDGSLDSSFGENGKVTTDFNTSDDQATSIALQGDNILVAGFSFDFTTHFALVRYTADGMLDSSFGVYYKRADVSLNRT